MRDLELREDAAKIAEYQRRRLAANDERPSFAGYRALAQDGIDALQGLAEVAALPATPGQGDGLDALRALSDAATPGPWVQREEGYEGPVIAQEIAGGFIEVAGRRSRADADYIAALVNWHRALATPAPDREP